MSQSGLLKITVTDLPRTTVEAIQAEAVRNGLPPTTVSAALRWALVQYANGLAQNNGLSQAPKSATDAA